MREPLLSIKTIRSGFIQFCSVFLLVSCGGGGGNGAEDSIPPSATYTISGTVSGLNGALVLQNNGKNDLTISNNGNFSFSTAISNGSNGSNYSISISSQPIDHICSVNNGNGTVSGSNISNVSVTCLQDFNIGGTVSGLSGTLILLSSSGDELTISADGSFQFINKIADLSSYSVTIKTQPSDRFCSVSNSSGTLAGSDVTNVSVVCLQSFSIGGAVSGLSGTLRLYSSGGDELILTADSSFQFINKVVDLSNYSVVVSSQPSDQFCRVTNHTGTLAGSDINNVQVSCEANPLTLQGQYGGGIPKKIAVAGNVAYFAATSGLLIVDITDPANPITLVNYDVPGNVGQVLVSGPNVYVGSSSGLFVINVSDPAVPYEVAQLDTPANYGTVLAGNYIYMLANNNLQTIDISNPAAPTIVNTLGVAHRGPMKLSGDYVYITNFNNGLDIYSISNSVEPVFVGNFSGDELDYPQNVAISGEYAYVADHTHGIKILNISDPTSPVYVGSYDLSGQNYDIAINGDYAYVANFTGGIQVLDISTPTLPTAAGSLGGLGWPTGIVHDGNRAYVTGFDNNAPISMIDLSVPTAPSLLGQYSGPGDGIGFTKTLAINGNHAYLAGKKLHIIDVAAPTNPQLATIYDINSSLTNDIVINNNLAYLVGNNLDILDITNPVSPSSIASSSSVTYGNGLEISGNYAYVAEWVDGLRIIDITTPSSPLETVLYDTPGQAQDVAVRGNYAYIADYIEGFRILDISQPSTPMEVSVISDYSTIYYPGKIVLNGNYVYLNSSANIIDITDPATPLVLNANNTMTNFKEIVISNNLAFVVGSYNDLRVFDISDPLIPVQIAAHDTRGEAIDVKVVGNIVYVAEYGYGLEIFELGPITP